MNNNNRMVYSLILSVVLILLGVKLIKTPTAKLVKYTGIGMTFTGIGLLFIEFRQNQQSIIDSTLSAIRMQTVVTPSPMASGPMPRMPSPAKSPAKSPEETDTTQNVHSHTPAANPGATFLLTLLIIGAGLTFIL